MQRLYSVSDNFCKSIIINLFESAVQQNHLDIYIAKLLFF